MNEYNVEEIADNICQLSTEKSIIQYEEVTIDIADNYVGIFVIIQIIWVSKQRREKQKALYARFFTIWGCYFHIFVYGNEE